MASVHHCAPACTFLPEATPRPLMKLAGVLNYWQMFKRLLFTITELNTFSRMHLSFPLASCSGFHPSAALSWPFPIFYECLWVSDQHFGRVHIPDFTREKAPVPQRRGELAHGCGRRACPAPTVRSPALPVRLPSSPAPQAPASPSPRGVWGGSVELWTEHTSSLLKVLCG